MLEFKSGRRLQKQMPDGATLIRPTVSAAGEMGFVGRIRCLHRIRQYAAQGSLSEERNQQRDGKTHRPGGAHQKGAQKADAFAIFREKPGDKRTDRRHDGVKH